jgi:hypothetical protein
MRFSPAFEINDVPSSISAAHPWAAGNAEQIRISPIERRKEYRYSDAR